MVETRHYLGIKCCVLYSARLTHIMFLAIPYIGFGNPRIMKIDLETARGSEKLKKIRQDVFDHHERWKRRVTNSKLKQGRCEDMRSRLNKCLREHL